MKVFRLLLFVFVSVNVLAQDTATILMNEPFVGEFTTAVQPQFEFETFENDPLNVKQFVLENGLTVLLSENKDQPNIHCMLTVKAGSKNDPSSATGIAHYLEHMLFKGTQELGTIDYEKEKLHLDTITALYDELESTTDKKYRKILNWRISQVSARAAKYAIPGEFDRVVSKIGGSDINAFTNEDFTSYFNTIPNYNIEQLLALYAHRFQNPVFRLFQSELEAVYEEKNISMDNPFGGLLETFNENFYKVHPYGQQTTLGKVEHLKNPSLKKMYEFYNTYYVPNNMVLCLSGDFDSEKIGPLVEKYFGKLQSKELPMFKMPAEKEFNGKEVVEVRMSPIKVGLIGYRIPSPFSDDYVKFKVAGKLLTNAESSGYFDALRTSGEVMEVTSFPYVHKDYSGLLIIYVPKLIGQSFDDVEALIQNRIDSIKSGHFSNEFVEASKLSLKKEYQSVIESNFDRNLKMAEVSVYGYSWKDYLNEYYSIDQISKEDLVEVINKYLGVNHLVVRSKMGFPKKKHLEKPEIEKVVSAKDTNSVFAKEIDEISSGKREERFVDYSKDFTSKELQEGVILRTVKNPFNNLFDLTFSWGIGSYHDLNLKYVVDYLDLLGTDSLTVSEFKNQLYQLGATLQFSVSENKFNMNISGHDKYFGKTVSIVNYFIQNIRNDEEKMSSIVDYEKTNRKMILENAHGKRELLNEYVLHGEDAASRKDYPMEIVENLTGDTLLYSFHQAMKYDVKVSYLGSLESDEVELFLKSEFDFRDFYFVEKEPVVRKRAKQHGTVIYLLEDKKAVQSHISVIVPSDPVDINSHAYANAFNKYFGVGMNSLCFQEIRELRSLAYATYGYFDYRKGRNRLETYVGCQSDKTIESLMLMMKLIQQIPQNEERGEEIKEEMINRAACSYPGYKELLSKVDGWAELGYFDDANKYNMAIYNDLEFAEIMYFYTNYIKGRDLIITIVANPKVVKEKDLEQIAPVVEIDVDDLYRE